MSYGHPCCSEAGILFQLQVVRRWGCSKTKTFNHREWKFPNFRSICRDGNPFMSTLPTTYKGTCLARPLEDARLFYARWTLIFCDL